MIFCIRIKLRMNIHQVLFFCFLSALQDGDTGLSNAVDLYAGAEGGSGSIQSYLTSSGNTKFFCKGECKEENILIKTDDVTAQSGRYSIEYKDGSSGRRIVYVTIKQLTKSDSGRYRCGLGGSLVPDSYYDFDLIVTDEATLGENTRFISAETEGGSITRGCNAAFYGSRKFFCKDECKKEEDILVETAENRAQSGRYSIKYTKGSAIGLYVTITQLKKSDSGRYMCGYGRPSTPDSSHWFLIIVVDDPTTEEPNWTLRPFPTSVPSASTPATTQSLISSSGSFTPSSSFPETTEQFAAVSDVSRPVYFWPLVVCVPVIVVLVAVVLLFVYKLKMRRNSGLNTRETSDSRNKELSVVYENPPPVSLSEDPVYQSLDIADMDPDQIYSTLTETANM
ncbi:polymeric immunoglobulin receptor-like [Scomber scombrus]|uniref:polymeric immunoglobulin receptor-like n=1 Tax=Scomber scombrus TaxID=13677 RepID=UPI002DDAD163|nr:polymeric immunoglobulin receptor-like [Scomber scombrus]